jgi:rhodanese-related sulfurtransferase
MPPKILCAALIFLATAGCGTNKFQQELERESIAVPLAREAKEGQYELLTSAELKKLIDDKAEMVLIDAMPAEEFRKEHIPGAVNFLFPKEKEKMAEWDKEETAGQTLEDYGKLLGDDKNKLIVAYCGFATCSRSHHAARWAKKLGYTNVKRHPGGIYAWKGANYPTEAVK